MKNLERELEEAKLYSNMDGTVVYVDTRLGGDYINAYFTLIRIADLQSCSAVFARHHN